MSRADCWDFRWIERGAGEPIVLLHGLMGQPEHWQATLEALAAFCRPMALALPIFDPELPEASLPRLTDYVREFLNARGLRNAVVGGNSLGGHVALELALTDPGRVSGLVLTGSSGLFERSFTRGVPHRPTSAWVREKMEEIFYNPAHVTSEWVERVQQTIAVRGSVLRLLQAARSAKSRNIEEQLPDLGMPTCLVWGEEDRITPPDVARRFKALIPEADLFLLPRCGHAPMMEQPALFNWILQYWLRHVRWAHAAPAVPAGAAA